jgi:ribose/xylose/arabinose/galactoside ABC-type transport system permease subunit
MKRHQIFIPVGTIDVAFRAGLALIVFIFLSVFLPNFANPSSIYAILETAVPVGLVALGVASTIVAGELDLSAGVLATCAGIITISLINHGFPMPVALVLVITGACAFGIVQGAAMAWLRIPSIVFTLGTQIAIGGAAYMLAEDKVVFLPVEQLGIAQAVSTRIGVFSPASITMLCIFLILGGLLGFTRWGREIYAIGGNRNESKAAGVPQSRPVIVAFALSATLAATAGALSSLRSGSCGPHQFDTLLFTAITAVLIGGVSLYGGRGRVSGVFFGVLTLEFLLAAFSFGGAPFWATNIAQGVLLLLFLVVELSQRSSPARAAIERALLARKQSQARSDGRTASIY